MSSINTSDLRAGVKFMLDGDPCNVLEAEFVKPGKGQAFSRIKMRNLKTGRVLEKTFKSNESVEAADVLDTDMQYMYNDGEMWHFMQTESFEQYQTDANAIGDNGKWLKEQDVCVVTLWNNIPITVTPPNHVVLKVTQTDPGMRGDTATGGSKPATLETGAVVKVPLFVNEGDILKVDTRTGEYLGRVKE